LVTHLKEYLNTIDKKEDNNDEQQHSIAAVENMSIKTLQTKHHKCKSKYPNTSTLAIKMRKNGIHT
jgi:hypothetical protein